MIVKMKKISIVVQSKDAEAALKSLANAEALHVEHQHAPTSNNILVLEERYRSLSETIKILSDASKTEGHKNPEKIVREILDLVDKKDVLNEGIKKIKQDIGFWKEWGNFNPELIYDLEEKNVWVRLCGITKQHLSQIPEGVILEELFRKGSVIYCAVISSRETALAFKTLQPPEQGLKEMRSSLEREEEKLRQVDEALQELSKYKNALLSHQEKLASIIQFSKVSTGMGRFERLSYVTGYCPVNNVKLLEDMARDEKWGLAVESPSDDDNVPTLIRNPRWVETIRPVFHMIKTIPGYKEVDISFWFLLFFSIFFGILVGDAGYGAVIFIINLLCHLRFRDLENKSIFFLMYVLSICAVLWGVLTGTFFGQAWLSQMARPLLPSLRENANVQALCFFIGAIHLSIAHAWRLIRKMPSLKAFSELGWILILWAAYFLARTLILGEVFPEQTRWLIIGGMTFIILFTNPTKNIFKTIGSGTGNLLLNVINSFTDLVSYIRLFAVGAATVAVADAFNQMAMTIGFGNIFAGFATSFILFFGHTLNILLGAMAILVHGVRLNVLEFSSHLNMEWSGIEYAPFKSKGD